MAKRIPISAPDAITSLAAVAAEMARHAASAQALEVLDRIPAWERTDRRLVGLRAWALAREFRLEEALAEARRFATMPAPDGAKDPIVVAAGEVLDGLESLPTLVSGRPIPIVVDPESDSERLRPPSGMKPPSAIERITPDYPEEARDSGMQGRAVFLVLVDAAGRVTEVFPQPLRVGARTHEKLFRNAALEVIRDWRYHPAKDDGQAVPAYVVQRVTFKLPPRPYNWRPHGLPADPDDPPDMEGSGGIG